MSDSEKYFKIFEILQRQSLDIELIGKVLGESEKGQVRELIMKHNKIMVGKVIKKQKLKDPEEVIPRGQNIVKIMSNKYYKIDDQEYNIIIMDKEILRDSGKIT